MESKLVRKYSSAVFIEARPLLAESELMDILREEFNVLEPHERAGITTTIIFLEQWRAGNFDSPEDLLVLSRIMERTLGPKPQE